MVLLANARGTLTNLFHKIWVFIIGIKDCSVTLRLVEHLAKITVNAFPSGHLLAQTIKLLGTLEVPHLFHTFSTVRRAQHDFVVHWSDRYSFCTADSWRRQVTSGGRTNQLTESSLRAVF